MRFVIDEDLPRSTARALREAGYVADDVRDIGLRGHTDREIFDRAQTLSAIILTSDTDFSNILEYPLKTHAGIIVSRIPDEVSTETLNRELLNALKQLHDENLTSTLVIVEIGQIRIRR
ncbi:MAG: DUF5615 family PIN-like protein [Chloroflexi bacterium]|nr:DUF5615 family PIN-like protein [Chloroflexota bacterium]